MNCPCAGAIDVHVMRKSARYRVNSIILSPPKDVSDSYRKNLRPRVYFGKHLKVWDLYTHFLWMGLASGILVSIGGATMLSSRRNFISPIRQPEREVANRRDEATKR